MRERRVEFLTENGIDGAADMSDEELKTAVDAQAFENLQKYATNIGIEGASGMSEEQIEALLSSDDSPIAPTGAAPDGAKYIATTTLTRDPRQGVLQDTNIYLLDPENRTVVYPYGSSETKQVPLSCLLYTSPSPRDS